MGGQGSWLQCGDKFKTVYRAARLIWMSPAGPRVTRRTPLPAKKGRKLETWPKVRPERFSQGSVSVRDERWLRSDLKWNSSRWWRKKKPKLSRYFEYNYSTSGRFFITVFSWIDTRNSSASKQKISEACDCWDIGLVAGAGFGPTTFGLWARRATRLLHPAFIFQTVNLTDFFYSCQIFVHQLLICDVRLKAHTKPPRQD